VGITVLQPDKRPVSTTADFTEIRDVSNVVIRQSADVSCTLLFDPDHSLEDRILKEQFVY
jgi:NAD+ kinase